MEPGPSHLIGQALGVLGQLGHRDIAVDHVEARGHQAGLEVPEAPEVLAQDHEGQVGLVAQDCNRDHLVTGIGRGRDGGPDRPAVDRPAEGRDPPAELAEEVEDAEALGGGDRFAHRTDSTEPPAQGT